MFFVLRLLLILAIVFSIYVNIYFNISPSLLQLLKSEINTKFWIIISTIICIIISI